MLVWSLSVMSTFPTLIRAMELRKFFMWSKCLFNSPLTLYWKSGPIGLSTLELKNFFLSHQSTSSKLRCEVDELFFKMVPILSIFLLLRYLDSWSFLKANKISTFSLSWRVQTSVSSKGPIMNAISGTNLRVDRDRFNSL